MNQAPMRTLLPAQPSLLEQVTERYLTLFPGEAATRLDGERSLDAARVLATLSLPVRVEVLARMNADAAKRVLGAFDFDIAAETLAAADPVRAARWLALCDAETRKRLLERVPDKPAQYIREALQFPPGTAGSLMDAGVVTFRPETTIADAFSRIRQVERRVSDVLICDEHDRLVGIVPLQELIGAPLSTSLGSVAWRSFPKVHGMANRDEVVELLTRHRLASLPVVDLDERLLGTIRYDGLVLAAQQAAADDLATMVGAGKEERALSTPWFTIKSRLPWLMINLATAFAAALVVGLFDETIAKFTALAVLLPVVAGQSGNTGAQALAVTSRGLALREIRVRHWLRVLAKETSASFGNGIAVAIVTSGAVLAVSGNSGLALVIGISMIISMVMAAMAGALIPVLLTAAGRDPATASSIILTTVTDIAGFFSFLGLATLFVDLLAG